MKCPVCVAFTHEAKATLIYCNQWKCSKCAKRLAGKWAKRTELAIASMKGTFGGDAWFLTLTLGSQYLSTLDGFQAIPRLWDTTRKAYQRYYGSFTYIAFVEGQEKRGGMPHFHIVTSVEPPTKRGRRGYVTKRGVHDFAVAYGWGYQAKLEIVTDSQAAVYVAKYASKGDVSMPKSFRRVRASADIPKLPDLGTFPLLVPAYEEDIAHFLARVVDATGEQPEALYQKWSDAQRIMLLERKR
jgi:hypothetical protein